MTDAPQPPRPPQPAPPKPQPDPQPLVQAPRAPFLPHDYVPAKHHLKGA